MERILYKDALSLSLGTKVEFSWKMYHCKNTKALTMEILPVLPVLKLAALLDLLVLTQIASFS